MALKNTENIRTKKQRDLDLKLIFEFKSQGLRWIEIASKVNEQRDYNLSFQTYHLQYWNALEKSNGGKDRETYIKEELQKLELEEQELYDSWFKSKGTIKETTKKGILNKNKGAGEGKTANDLERQEQTIKEYESAGNPAFITALQKIKEQRAKLLGLYAPTKVAPTDTEGNDLFSSGLILKVEKEVRKPKTNESEIREDDTKDNS